MTYEVGSRYPKPGDAVKVVQKKDYSSGKLTEGVVKDVLTKKQIHPRGHKVRLTSGIIGRVQKFSDQKEPPEPTKTPKSPSFSYKPSEDDLV
jgi:uncharacterized repeat protein (TIGR03833 family)